MASKGQVPVVVVKQASDFEEMLLSLSDCLGGEGNMAGQTHWA